MTRLEARCVPPAADLRVRLGLFRRLFDKRHGRPCFAFDYFEERNLVQVRFIDADKRLEEWALLPPSCLEITSLPIWFWHPLRLWWPPQPGQEPMRWSTPLPRKEATR